MYKIAALVYKAKLGDGHIVDDAINIWTALFNMPAPWKFSEWKEWITGSYSHIELWISDETGNFYRSSRLQGPHDSGPLWVRDYIGQSYTSSMRGDRPGTVLRPASEVIKDPARWDVGVVCEISSTEPINQYKWLMDHINIKVENNQGYDMLCIADFFNLLRRWLPLHDKTKQICAEAFQEAVWVVSRRISEYICSPRRIVRILKKRGVVFTPVTEM